MADDAGEGGRDADRSAAVGAKVEDAGPNRRRDRVTVAAVMLLGGIVWLALARDPQWAGWGLAGVGLAWLIGEIRR